MDNRKRYGFRLYKQLTGSGMSEVHRMIVADAYAANPGGAGVIDINVGDPVVMANDGTVTVAAAAGVIWGVVVGIEQYWDSVKNVLWKGTGNKLPSGTTSATIWERRSLVQVQRVDSCLWEVDVDDIVTATTQATYQALVGENADFSWNTVVAEKRGWPMLDISDHKAATAQWRIIQISETPENADFAGQWVKLIVQCNEVQSPPAQTAGI